MSILKFVSLDMNVHKEIFVQLNIELLTWIKDKFQETYQLDAVSSIGRTVPEYVDDHLGDLARLKPPGGIIYLLIVEGEIAGMGALRKLSDRIGEIKRMYIRPLYRGNGYGKEMLNKLLETGRKLGCTSFLLETSKFMTVAHNIYKSAGFIEREEYLGTETPPTLRQYQRYMEKKK